MASAAEYRKRAAECRRYAARSAIPAHAETLIEIAEMWEQRAAEAAPSVASAPAAAGPEPERMHEPVPLQSIRSNGG